MFDPKKGQIAAIGDEDSMVVLSLAGITVFCARNKEAALEKIDEVINQGFGLCLIQDEFYPLVLAKQKIEGGWQPVFLPFRDYRQAVDLIQSRLRELAIKATGSDSLLKQEK